MIFTLPCDAGQENIAMKTIYRAEAIGSLLRPVDLRNARHSLRSREITTAEIKKIEDRAVDETIALQEAAELDLFWLLW